MSLNWYLDVDGESHSLHSRSGWSDITVKDIDLPADDLLTLGTVDGRCLLTAMREVSGALGAVHRLGNPDEGPQPPALPFHLSVGIREGAQYFLVNGKIDGIAISRAMEWTPSGEGPELHALTSTDQLEGLHSASGQLQLSLGAHEDWTATLALSAGTDRHRLRLLRAPREDSPFRLIEGQSLVRAMVPVSELVPLLADIPPEQDVTIAFVPGRVLIRSAAGMLGALSAETIGDPRQGTFHAGFVRAGLDAFHDEIKQVRLALFEEPDSPTLRVDDPDAHARFSVVASGWSYR
ncbi:MAG: hypothetical protein ACTHWV_05540 [Brachybacterium sp.]